MLAALLLIAAGALADGGDSTGLDGMRAQAIYWSYPEALIEDYSEMTLNGRVYALILFRHEGKQKLQISYRDDEEGEESDWTDWFTTEGALPQGERAQRLRTSGCSIKPYLDTLGENEMTEFLGELLEAVKENIPVQGDGNVILKMPRLFFTAKK